MHIRRQAKTICIAALITAAFVVGVPARADTLQDLKRAIVDRNAEIQRLEEEAKKFREEIASRQEQAKTLTGELGRVDRRLGQLKYQISLTSRQIEKKALEIQVVALEIRQKEDAIARLRLGLGGILQIIRERDQESLVRVLVTRAALSDFFRELDHATILQDKTVSALDTLRTLQQELVAKKSDAEAKKKEREDLNGTLRDQKKIQESEKRSRSQILQETKNQEKQYQQLLRERETRRIALEDEVREIEEKIRVTIDPTILPHAGTGVLGWPLPNISPAACRKNFTQDSITNCITQFFGYTSFAAIGAYSGKGHNGTDFRADIGTPISAAEAGEVTATGDTDLGCNGASYGKWILIRHPNNLSTLYAHLSQIGVASGQSVTRGTRIGYAGKSGYATGPHLHFSVFATQAVRIESIVSSVCGRTMTLPISAINGYLNPLDYL